MGRRTWVWEDFARDLTQKRVERSPAFYRDDWLMFNIPDHFLNVLVFSLLTALIYTNLQMGISDQPRYHLYVCGLWAGAPAPHPDLA